MTKEAKVPGLFGQKHSSRDYTKEKSWGKNMFNSSFPASLIAYMSSKVINPVYLCTNKKNDVCHKTISPTSLFGIDPLSEDAYYNYEAEYYPYEQYYNAIRKEKIDLVMINRTTRQPVSGLEIKLTTLPDNTTKDLCESEYGSEIVVRSPTILFLACSICACYDNPKKKAKLHDILNTIGTAIKHWNDIWNVLPHYEKIKEAILNISADLYNNQTPLIVQPVWKTDRNMSDLDENCLDVFVWSNLAVIQMCLREKDTDNDISRNQRTIVWLYRMLWDFTQFGKFDYADIVNDLAYKYKTDKAFAISGKQSNVLMRCRELAMPRISKYEIRNIILGDGQKLLKPERRFDAYLVSHPELFERQE